MIRRILEDRLVFIVFLLLVLIILLLNVFTAYSFYNFSRRFVEEKLDSGVSIINTRLDEARSNSRTAAVSVAKNSDVCEAVICNDTDELLRLLNYYLELYHVNFFTVTDETGNVIIRTHRPDRYGDNISSQQNIRNAMFGRVSSYYEEGTIAKVAVRSGAPIYNRDGEVVGVVSAGVRFDTEQALETLKTQLNAEITVYYEDAGVVSTMADNGKTAADTALTLELRDILYNEKREFYGEVMLFDARYETYYLPLLNAQNDVFAVISIAVFVEDLIQSTNIILLSVIFVGVIGIAISLILLNALNNSISAGKAKSSFLANMSHEMRTPLNAVIGLSQLTLEDTSLSHEACSNIEKIYNSGSTLLAIVNDILDISKIESGKFELNEIVYQTPSLINDTVTQNLLRIGDKPIEFVLDISPDTYLTLHGDDLRTKQIINNLLSNAIKYTEKGMVTLKLVTEKDGDDVIITITVSDTGKGIKPQDIDKLFNDYAQLDVKSNRKVEGTGLGLPITKQLAQMMRGCVTVTSEYGKGSVFTTTLRQKFVNDNTIGEETTKSLKSFRYSEHKRGNNVKTKRIQLPYAHVLVVDDNQTNLDVTKGLMKPYGMRVDCVLSGFAAVDLIKAEKTMYNAIFMDHMMPEMDGIDSMLAIRAIGTDYAKNIPIIALTANAVAGADEMFISKGFQGFLSKPVDLQKLDEVIRAFVRDKSKEAIYAELPTADAAAASGISIPMLNCAEAIANLGGDTKVYLSVLRSFAASTRKLLPDIEAFTPENIESYGITVHGIKGAARGVGAFCLGETAYNLEKAAKANNITFIEQTNKVFVQAANSLLTAIDAYFTDLDAKNPKPKKDKPAPELLERLACACSSFDMDGIDSAMDEIEKYEYETDNDLIEWLRENIDLMNLEEIAHKLKP